MNPQNFNSYFGDMDLFLMDLILKGKIPPDAKVLDVGCGEGRNGVHFIQNKYEYHGWDTDTSKLQLVEYLAKSLENSNAHFESCDLRNVDSAQTFDFIICSRVLHFAESEEDFLNMWQNLTSLLKEGGILYVSMDSSVDNHLGKSLENGMVEFPDSKIRFVLTSTLYKEIKKGFEEIEPLRTLVQHEARAQSFMCLKKS